MNSDKLTAKSSFLCVCLTDISVDNDLDNNNSNKMNLNINDCQLIQNNKNHLINNNEKVNEFAVSQDENVVGDNVQVAANLKKSNMGIEKGIQTDIRIEVKKEKEKRRRTKYTTAQKEVLEREFSIDHFIVGSRKKNVAQSLNITEKQVKVWFQNRRNKEKEKLKKEKICVKEKPISMSSSSTDSHPQTVKKSKNKKQTKTKNRKSSAITSSLLTTNSQSDITSSCNNVTDSGNDQNEQKTNRNNDILYLDNVQQQYYSNQNLQTQSNFNQFYGYQFPEPYPIKIEPPSSFNYFGYNNNQLPNSFNYNFDMYNRNGFQANICCCCPHIKNENYFQDPQNLNSQDEALSNWIHFVLKNM